MMRNNNFFISALDKIRKEKHISITQLTEGIVSERTYRRYVNLETNVNTTVFLKLFDRLNIKVADMLFYLIHDKNKSLEMKEFLMAIYRETYDCSWDNFEAIKDYKNDIAEIDILVQTFVRKYEYHTHKISQEEYHKYLVEHLDKFVVKDIENIYVLSFLTLYLEEFPDNDFITLEKLMEEFTQDYAHKQRAILYLIAADKVLKEAENRPDINKEDYKALVKLFAISAYICRDMYFIEDANFHKALFYYKMEDGPEFEKYLFRYLMGRILVRDEYEFITDKNQLEALFGIDINQFQINYAKKVLKN